ncbi:MAG: hypothetical protein Aureis2KO_05940 [Aureisphaera sp.]
MKFTKKLLLLLFGIITLHSCETEKAADAQLFTTADVKVIADNPSPESDPYTLENYSQWAAFTTSYLLRYSPDAQSLFQHKLGAGNVVDFDDVFQHSISAGPYNFAKEFKSRLFYYINCCPDPDDETQKPPPPGTPPFGGGDPDPEVLVQQIMDYLLQDNCMEFYFPNGINFWGQYSITSTAHPLNTTLENSGILRIHTPIVNEDYPNGISTFPQLVNDEYAGTGNMIIMARPVRSTSPPTPTDPCLYTEYSDVDFTLFLD